MLDLIGIKKDYLSGDSQVHALKGVDISFGKNEFVAILGQSGCGKTTLLNIVGGLDRATDGELIVNGVSTKGYGEKEWNSYRNGQIGFVFQSYNLIPHMSVLKNVELALTLAGVSAEERKQRSLDALKKVGLEDEANKKPNQISGGQAQRVAIARAIVNSPKILLADEPTGAVDSETSVDIMNVLREISREFLVLLVTHNQELAYGYSDRIVRMKDGIITDDVVNRPTAVDVDEEENFKCEESAPADGKKHKASMSFGTAFKLSLTNLISKKGRSAITVIAGSISIICIALILAMNSGFAGYIERYETNSLAQYPITVTSSSSSIMEMIDEALNGDDIDASAININSMVDIFKSDEELRAKYSDAQIVYLSKVLLSAMEKRTSITDEESAMSAFGIKLKSDISKFTAEMEEKYDESWGTVRKDYNMSLNVYQKEEDGTYTQLNPLYDRVLDMAGDIAGGVDITTQNEMRTMLDSLNTWSMMVDDGTVLSSQYDVLAGHFPDYTTEEGSREIVIVVDEYNQLDDYVLFCLNKITMLDFVFAMLTASSEDIPNEYNFDEFIGEEFTLMVSSDYYSYNADTGLYDFSDTVETIDSKGIKLKIGGIVRLKEGLSGGCIGGTIGYTQALAEYLINGVNASQVAIAQKAEYAKYQAKAAQLAALMAKTQEEGFDMTTLTIEEQALLASAEYLAIKSVVTGEDIDTSAYEQFMTVDLDVKDLAQPSVLSFYPVSIDAKDKIISFLNGYNEKVANDEELASSGVEYEVTYSDDLSEITASMSSMINTITYILIAVAAIAVIVAMLLVAIILYISVQDRTKEIGILRALGASRGNVSGVFMAETFIIGLISGVAGVLLGLLCMLPANAIIVKTMGITDLLQPVWWHELVLIALSFVITVISGLIPASVAARKDPVLALRTE